jgi:hypothetical protein
MPISIEVFIDHMQSLGFEITPPVNGTAEESGENDFS